MRIEYEPALMERAIFLIASRDPEFEGHLHGIIDPLYERPPGRERENAFQNAYAALFVRFGLHGVIDQLLAEQPLIATNIAQCIVRQAVRSTSESAELLIRKAGADPTTEEKTLMIQVAASSLLEPADLRSFLRRELLHAADMLDPGFQYQMERFEGTPAKQNLVRDRYRLLWDIHVEGRLHRKGLGEERAVARLRDLFVRLFPHDGDESAQSVFDAVLNTPHLAHPQLMTWSSLPGKRVLEPGSAR